MSKQAKQTNPQRGNVVTVHNPMDDLKVQGDSGQWFALSQFHIVDEEGDGYSPFDIADEFVAVESNEKALNGKKKQAASHLLKLAAKCGKTATFRAVCELVESQRKWGLAPKGSEASERAKYRKAPDTWKTYKARILAAMDNGIMPGTKAQLKYKLPKPNKEGKTEVVKDEKLDSIRKLIKATDQAKQGKGSDQESETDHTAKPGKHFNSYGEVKEVHAGQATSLTDKDKDDIKTMAGIAAPELVGYLTSILELYEQVDETERKKAMDTLKRLKGRLEAKAPHNQEEAKQAANA